MIRFIQYGKGLWVNLNQIDFVWEDPATLELEFTVVSGKETYSVSSSFRTDFLRAIKGV